MKLYQYGNTVLLGLLVSACGGGGGGDNSPSPQRNASVCYNEDLSAQGAEFTVDYSFRGQYAQEGEELVDLSTLESEIYGFRVSNGSQVTFNNEPDIHQLSIFYRDPDINGNLVENSTDPEFDFYKFDDDNKILTNLGYAYYVPSNDGTSAQYYENVYLPTGLEERYDLETNEEYSSGTITRRTFIDGEYEGDITIEQATKFLGVQNITVNGKSYQACKMQRSRTIAYSDFTSESTYVYYLGVGNGINLKSTFDAKYSDGNSYRSIRELTAATINGKSL
ncbi:hypothetical protein G5S52_05615 [Grimontia sp. S25]|uniref:Uncharacterized protein n=1 Tax=Grimontia sedimenti TaxID=2711294 RepID=A0A6M1RAN4_9GAMM|nr:hypothetical protein [Grimontia sedimenti]NGN97150.1 hypothetical protein [Grimontia sedimenti]